jgi:hypothetical protein
MNPDGLRRYNTAREASDAPKSILKRFTPGASEISEIPIDTDVPMPPDEGSVARAVRKLSVGDSFVVYTHAHRMAAYQAATKLGVTVKSKKTRGTQEARIWRIK